MNVTVVVTQFIRRRIWATCVYAYTCLCAMPSFWQALDTHLSRFA